MSHPIARVTPSRPGGLFAGRRAGWRNKNNASVPERLSLRFRVASSPLPAVVPSETPAGVVSHASPPLLAGDRRAASCGTLNGTTRGRSSGPPFGSAVLVNFSQVCAGFGHRVAPDAEGSCRGNIGDAILASALLLSDRIERLERAVRESGLESAAVETRDGWEDDLPVH